MAGGIKKFITNILIFYLGRFLPQQNWIGSTLVEIVYVDILVGSCQRDWLVVSFHYLFPLSILFSPLLAHCATPLKWAKAGMELQVVTVFNWVVKWRAISLSMVIEFHSNKCTLIENRISVREVLIPTETFFIMIPFPLNTFIRLVLSFYFFYDS